MPYGLTDIELQKLLDVFAQNERIDQVILYGSRAKGNFKPFSDVDITLVGNELSRDDLNKVIQEIDDLLLPYQFDVSLKHKLKNAALIDHIERRGIKIYKKESLGEWKEYKLGEICDVRDGTHDSPKQCKIGKPLVTSKNIKNGHIDLTNTYLISDNDFDFVNQRSKVELWDVLFSMIGTVGECAIVRDSNNFAIKNVGLFKTDSNQILAKWIYYYLQSDLAKEEINARIKGSTQQYISLGDLRNFPIFLPPQEEQKRITSILGSLDDKIDLLYRENKTLEAMAETLFRKWFIEDAKEDWEEKTLYDCILLVGGGTPKTNNEIYWNGNICWISCGDISNNHKGYIIDTEKNITLEGLNNSSTKILPENAFVISARGTVGKYCLLSKPMAFSQSNYGILPKEHECFFFTYLLVSYYVDELQSAAYGSVFDTITTNTFKGINIFLPSINEIITFENHIKDYFEKIKLNTKQIRKLSTIKELLLLRLISNRNVN